jgi:hypothetical protein
VGVQYVRSPNDGGGASDDIDRSTSIDDDIDDDVDDTTRGDAAGAWEGYIH